MACLFILNWAAPGAFRSKTQTWQKEVLGRALSSMPGSLGVLLSPVYYHKRGNLWACEQALLQMLSSENINTDRMAALLFKGRRDERDSRPVAQRCSEVRCCVRSLWCIAAPCGGGGAVWGKCGPTSGMLRAPCVMQCGGGLCAAMRCGVAWCSGVVQCIVVRSGALLYGVVRVLWCGDQVRCSVMQCGAVPCCVVWRGVVQDLARRVVLSGVVWCRRQGSVCEV